VNLDAQNYKVFFKIALCSLYAAALIVTLSHRALQAESTVSCRVIVSKTLYAYSK